MNRMAFQARPLTLTLSPEGERGQLRAVWFCVGGMVMQSAICGFRGSMREFLGESSPPRGRASPAVGKLVAFSAVLERAADE